MLGDIYDKIDELHAFRYKFNKYAEAVRINRDVRKARSCLDVMLLKSSNNSVLGYLDADRGNAIANYEVGDILNTLVIAANNSEEAEAQNLNPSRGHF